MSQLSDASRHYLLRLSRHTLEEYLQFRRKPKVTPKEHDLLEKRGAFVTLYREGNLRGCVGFVFPIVPLFQAVIDCSVSAATDDHRFKPLQYVELAGVKIEISILSDVKRVESIGEITVGVHGLLISREGKRGLLLPRVPCDHNWTVEEFLQQTCKKAGLAADEWREGAQIESFTATVIAEGDATAESNRITAPD